LSSVRQQLLAGSPGCFSGQKFVFAFF